MVQKSNRENIMITGGECVGCRSCEQVCPTGCIVFKPDEEGSLAVLIQMNGKQNIERLKRRKICGRSSLPNMCSLISDDAMRLQKQG